MTDNATLFKIGDILRYGSGSSALMRVSYVSVGHGGSPARYYGQHCLGGSHGAYHENVKAATEEDRRTWEQLGAEYKRTPWHEILKGDREIVGAVED